jgi:AraC-like DNA-binding protein
LEKGNQAHVRSSDRAVTIASLANGLDPRRKTVNSSTSTYTGLPPWKLRRVTEHIEARLAETIKVQELAELSGLSEPQFARLFSQVTGLPPHRWHLSARIRRAQALLFETNLPLVEVALIVGFADQSHFNKVFRRHVGVSPGAWRSARADVPNPDRSSAGNDWRMAEPAFFNPRDARPHRDVWRPTEAGGTEAQGGRPAHAGGFDHDDVQRAQPEAQTPGG